MELSQQSVSKVIGTKSPFTCALISLFQIVSCKSMKVKDDQTMSFLIPSLAKIEIFTCLKLVLLSGIFVPSSAPKSHFFGLLIFFVVQGSSNDLIVISYWIIVYRDLI
jgi:hypothetical protein